MGKQHTSRGDRRRKRRPRPTPKWLKESREMDEMARRRALVVLSVLSGETTVTDAIQRGGMSRGTYYKLEEKALKAMVASLMPGAEETGDGQSLTLARKIEELEGKLARAEKEKRRTERLLHMTRKVVGRGRLTTGKGGRKAGASTRKKAGEAGR